jgi:MFS transporter, ACS family, tartrate transporter
VVYLAHWYRPKDRARAKAWFMISQPLSVVIGLPVSRWILENVHWLGLSGWRWVFILEGLPPVVLGFVTLFYLTDRVHQAQWLPADEREWLASELAAEDRERTAQGRVNISAAFAHPQTLLLALSFFLIVTGNQAILFFLPSITDAMKSMSISARTLVTVLPYVFSIFGILLNGYWASRTGERRWHTAVPMLLSGASLSLAILSGDHIALVIACFCMVGFTFQAYLPVFWSLPSSFLGKSASATAVGAINSIGNLGGFVGPFLFGYLKTSTGSYRAGLWILTGCMVLAGICASAIRIRQGGPAGERF